MRTLRGRLAAAFAAAVLGTVLFFGTATAIAIFVHDHNERVSFTGNAAQAQGWVGDDLEDGKKLGIAMLIVSPIAVVVAGLFGFWLAGRALAPMHEAAARARRALRGDGELELPVRGIGDEWDELAQVTNELLRAQANAAAQAKAFSANAAHELRTPLTAMLGEVQVTLRRDRNAEEYRDALLVVEEEARRLGRLVEVLLALARADAGTLNPATIRFDIARAARLAADRAIVAHKGADRRLSLRLAPATALGDPLLTGRVFDNLLDNALRHGGEHVEIAVTAMPEWVRVTVSDDGPGIPATIRDRVFERFSREGAPSTGFGLGLAIARALAEAQGGHLSLDDGPGGARFVVDFPTAPD
jgi:two-component system heavy metal sensor histidine kinase CusS